MKEEGMNVAVIHREEPELTPFEVIERVITSGDLAKMEPAERVSFYWRTCESLGLNPLTRPFEFINLNGKLTMYARKDATDQLRRINGVSVNSLRSEKDAELGILTVTVGGVDRTGRADQSTGVVAIKGLSGEALANAIMKAETKAKRRLTLSLVGLGFLDESEVDGQQVDVDPDTGEITVPQPPASLLDAVKKQQAAYEAATPPETAPEAPTVEIWTVVPLSAQAFTKRLSESKVPVDVASAAFHAHYPDVERMADLTDEQRGELWDVIQKHA